MSDDREQYDQNEKEKRMGVCVRFVSHTEQKEKLVVNSLCSFIEII